ncbi:hypothetical protein ABZ599_37055 [Streptomyces misionensis]|uniref:MmyB family transcriptional regulator n=1 Tax=Streptomyces misionensis TaxID=67331 RepID=UPI0033CDC937
MCRRFAQVWNEHPIGWRHSEQKRLVHPGMGELPLHCQSLLDPDQAQTLLVFTAPPRPGGESYEKLQLLAVIGFQNFNS